jgi:hypothetical protein
MAQTWEEMTQAEKIDDLHRDVIRLFAAYNDLNRRLSASGGFVDEALKTARMAAAEVAAFSDRLAKTQDNDQA